MIAGKELFWNLFDEMFGKIDDILCPLAEANGNEKNGTRLILSVGQAFVTDGTIGWICPERA